MLADRYSQLATRNSQLATRNSQFAVRSSQLGVYFAGSMFRIAEIRHRPPARTMTNDDHMCLAVEPGLPAIS